MIRPDKHMNPDISVINISSFILEQLSSFYDIGYDDLLRRVIDNMGVNAKENFPYALNFLYLLGKLEYLEDIDSFKLCN